jgi:hypothetical protein
MKIGWVSLHRKIVDSRVFANEGLLKVWIYCLCRANHEKNYVPITTGKGTTEVEVNPGEFIFGRNVAAKELKMNPSTLYKRMQKLEKMENVNIQSNNHYSIVSICNWETYQTNEIQKEQPKEQASNNQVTAKEQPSNTDNNDNNDNNDKKSIPTLPEVQDYFESNGYSKQLAERAFNMYNASIEDNPKRKYWRDSRDNPIKNWKLKMQSVWFKEENRKNGDSFNPEILKNRSYV